MSETKTTSVETMAISSGLNNSPTVPMSGTDDDAVDEQTFAAAQEALVVNPAIEVGGDAVYAVTSQLPQFGLTSPGAAAVSTTFMSQDGFATNVLVTTESQFVDANQPSNNELEIMFNECLLAFDEIDKKFISRAKVINDWEKLLKNNNQLIDELNEAVQLIKTDQEMADKALNLLAKKRMKIEKELGLLEMEIKNPLPVEEKCGECDPELKQLSEDMKMSVNMSQDNANITSEIEETLYESFDEKCGEMQLSEELKNSVNISQDNTNLTSGIEETLYETFDEKCGEMLFSDDFKELVDITHDNIDPIEEYKETLDAHISSVTWVEKQTLKIIKQMKGIENMGETQKRSM